jgi:hypothetical protein
MPRSFDALAQAETPCLVRTAAKTATCSIHALNPADRRARFSVMATTTRRIRPLSVMPILWLALGGGSVLAQDKPATPASEQAAACDATPEDFVAEGVGPTVKDARRDALRKAIALSVRKQVDSEEMDKQKSVIEAKVLSEADWVVVESADAAPPFTRDGVAHATVRAKICVSRLTKVLVKNSIKVREVDLQTIQEDSIQLADRDRSVAEIAADVFRGFPTSMIQTELLEEVRTAGDDKASIVEVPVRVWIDKDKWQAWAKQSKKRLDLIAEAKGTDPWDTDWQVTKPGWHDLWRSTSKEGKSKRMSTGHYERLRSLSKDHWVCRFVPDAFRDHGGKAKLYLGNASPQWPTIFAQKKRLVCIFDPWTERTLWWQLPKPAYEAVECTIEQPLLRVRIEDQEGRVLGESITGWSEGKASDDPDVADAVFIEPHSSIGGEALRVAAERFTGSDRMFASEFICVMGVDEGLLFLPLGVVTAGDTRILAPSMVFPHRIRIPSEQLREGTKTSARLSLAAQPLLTAESSSIAPTRRRSRTPAVEKSTGSGAIKGK